MNIYQNILVAIYLNAEANKVVQKAHQLSLQSGAKLTLIHVTEPLSYAYGGDIPMDLSVIQTQLHDDAEERMSNFVKQQELLSHDYDARKILLFFFFQPSPSSQRGIERKKFIIFVKKSRKKKQEHNHR